MFDHYRALVQTICQRLSQSAGAATAQGRVGGSTFTFDVWEGHPHAEEAYAALARFRASHAELYDRIERFNAELAGRPELVKGNSQLLFGGMGRLSEHSLINIKNKSHAVTAEVVVLESGAEGVMVAQGGAFAGWSLYAKEGRPTYCYNLLGLERFKIEADAAIGEEPRQRPMHDGCADLALDVVSYNRQTGIAEFRPPNLVCSEEDGDAIDHRNAGLEAGLRMIFDRTF